MSVIADALRQAKQEYAEPCTDHVRSAEPSDQRPAPTAHNARRGPSAATFLLGFLTIWTTYTVYQRRSAHDQSPIDSASEVSEPLTHLSVADAVPHDNTTLAGSVTLQSSPRAEVVLGHAEPLAAETPGTIDRTESQSREISDAPGDNLHTTPSMSLETESVLAQRLDPYILSSESAPSVEDNAANRLNQRAVQIDKTELEANTREKAIATSKDAADSPDDPSAPPILERLRVEGIIISDRRSMAVINGSPMTTGQTVENATIVKIAHTGVTVRVGEQMYTIPLRAAAGHHASQ